MTTLITGGGSKVGIHLGLLLKASGREAIFASRSGNRIPEGFRTVKLDWKDPSTFKGALDTNPTYIYLVGDTGRPDSYQELIPFIDAAVKKGDVKKFINISATVYSEEAGVAVVPKYLKEKHIDHVILRPTWFMDNMTMILGSGANKKDQFETATSNGRIPFVASVDIARAGLRAITEDVVNKDIIVNGPELLTYTELGNIAGEVLGRKITHKAISAEERLEKWGAWAKWLIDQEVDIANHGIEEKWWNMSEEEAAKQGVEVFKGKVTLRQWIEENKALFD